MKIHLWGSRSASTDRDAYIARWSERIRDCKDESLLAAWRAFGPMYADQDAYHKALADLRNHGRRYWAMVDLCGKIFPESRPKAALEIGCNTGFLSFFHKDLNPSDRVVAVDKSERQIQVNQIAKKILRVGVEFVALEGEAVAGSLGTGRFDIVYLCEILEHIDYLSAEQQQVLMNALDVINSNGVVIVTVPFEDRIPAPGHLTVFTREMLLNLIGRHAVHVQDLDVARERYGLQKHLIMLASKENLPAIHFN